MSAVAQGTSSRNSRSADSYLARDIAGAFARENLKPSKAALKAASKVMAEVMVAITKLPEKQSRRILSQKGALTDAIETAVEELAARIDVKPQPVKTSNSIERNAGKGIGKLLTPSEGRSRLIAYAAPQRLEDWAGDVAGATEIERTLGISRSTLHYWNARGAVVGLQKGTRNRVFPLEQFIDGHPVEGLGQVLDIIENPRAAWQWLIQYKPGLKASPLDRLKGGEIARVLAAAARDFG